jgi:hypothetical protein
MGGNRPSGSWPMRTTKAYLAGLGTTGVLIASVLTVMAIGTGLVGFDGHEFGGGGSPLERVVVGDGAHAKRAKSEPTRTDAGGQPVVAGAERQRVAPRRLRAGRRAPRRRSHGHGGTPVGADVLSGGAVAGRRAGGGTGKPPERSGGGATPRSSPPPAAGGGMLVPAPIERAEEH